MTDDEYNCYLLCWQKIRTSLTLKPVLISRVCRRRPLVNKIAQHFSKIRSKVVRLLVGFKVKTFELLRPISTWPSAATENDKRQIVIELLLVLLVKEPSEMLVVSARNICLFGETTALNQ